jgi:hypothetical protein
MKTAILNKPEPTTITDEVAARKLRKASSFQARARAAKALLNSNKKV